MTFRDGAPFDATVVRYDIDRVETLATSPIEQVRSGVDSTEVLAPNEV